MLKIVRKRTYFQIGTVQEALGPTKQISVMSDCAPLTLMNFYLIFYFAKSNLRNTTRLERYWLNFSKVIAVQIDIRPIWRSCSHYFRQNLIIKIICLQEKAPWLYRHSLRIIDSASIIRVKSLLFRIQGGGSMRNRASHSRSWSHLTWSQMWTRQYSIPNSAKTKMNSIFLNPWLIGLELLSPQIARSSAPKLLKPQWPTTTNLQTQSSTKVRCTVNFHPSSPKKWASNPDYHPEGIQSITRT